jgi:tyrosyl-tRNA synthetase
VGGATGLIGDPKEGGERLLQDKKTIAHNTRCIKKQLTRLLGDRSIPVFDNATWLTKLTLLDFLRDIGKHFSINQLIKRDIIKRRLEHEEDSISFAEFSYSLLQGYDYLHLYEKHGIDLQIGGSDQWANIISGVDLIRRKKQASAYALTTPIVVDGVTGKKFGKSEGNAIWLDPVKTTPYAFYQFWISVADENVHEYLKIFTFLALEEIDALMLEHSERPHERKAQRALARHVTAFVHGVNTAHAVEKVSSMLFGTGPLKNLTLSPAERALVLKEIPHTTVTRSELVQGISLLDALVAIGLAQSKADARRVADSGGVSVNGDIVQAEYVLHDRDLSKGMLFIRRGKKIGAMRVA